MHVSRATGVKLWTLAEEKRQESDRREGQREEREADGHGLSRHASVRRGGEEDPFRWDTKPEGHSVPVCVCVCVRVCGGGIG